MKNTKKPIENILILFGNEYKKNYLKKWEINKMKDNSFEALKFFIHHSFMRGRKDELSNKYSKFAIEVLEKCFKDKKLENLNEIYDELIEIKKESGKKNIINQNDFEKIKKEYTIIEKLTQKNGLSNGNDLILLINILVWMHENKIENIFVYLERKIKNNELIKVNSELQKIYGIGDKIASFILRDIILLSPNIKISNITNLEWAFPVDTWIAQVASKLLDESFDTKKPKKLKNYVSDNFSKENLPLIAAGLWYLGANSLEIIINLIKKQQNFYKQLKLI